MVDLAQPIPRRRTPWQGSDIIQKVAFVIALPNQASVPELVANTRLESTL